MQRHLLRRASGQARRVFCTSKSVEVSVEVPAAPGDGPNHRSIMALDGHTIRPFVQPNSYVAPSASVIGSVVVNDRSAVMYGAVVRGDLAVIHVGAHVTVGENATLHAGAVEGSLSPADAVSTGLPIRPELFVGDYSFVGANASLKSCYLRGDNVIGHCATVGDGARLGRYAVVLPGSSVGEDVEIPDGEVWGGSPAAKVGELSDDDKTAHRSEANESYALMQEHSSEFLPVGTAYLEKEALEKKKEMEIIE